jgi:hypothetical protein
MREAGELLRGIGEADDRMLISRRLLDVAHRLDRLRDETATEESPTAPDEPPGEPVPIESLGFDSEIVPVESLAPDGPVPEEVGGLELSFRTFGRLVRERGAATPSLQVLLGRAASPSSTAPRSVTVPEEPAVAIDTLCYHGHAALQRALAVRHQIAAELTGDASLESLQPLLQELLDLVPLALADA